MQVLEQGLVHLRVGGRDVLAEGHPIGSDCDLAKAERATSATRKKNALFGAEVFFSTFCNVCPYFGGLVLGCTKANVCKSLLIFQHIKAPRDLRTFATRQIQRLIK